jgi:NAD(P)-dependent dehydrogenase (short-subunit alcohol dehydrogenase family)
LAFALAEENQKARAKAKYMAEEELKGEVALVTGSSQGIGAGIARKFAAHGADVVIHGLNDDAGSEVANGIRAAGRRVVSIWGDLRDASFCRHLIECTLKQLGRLDILVNNAATTRRSNIEDDPLKVWDEILAINLRAPFILCQEAVKHMKQRGGGCIINIGSVNAYIGGRKLLAYSVSKGGLMTFTKNLANYLIKYRIRVNQINPGWVLTEGERHVQSVVEGKGEGWLKRAEEGRPFGRLLSPDEIAQAALFLATAPVLSGAVIDYEQGPVGALPEL